VSRAPRCACTTGTVCSAALRSGDIGFAEATSTATGARPTWWRCCAVHRQPRARWSRWSTAAGGARWLYRMRTCSTATRAAAAARTSTPTTTWATPSTAVAGRAMNYSSAWFEGDLAQPTAGAGPRCAARCERRRATRPAPAGDRLRLGRAGRDGGTRLRRPRHRRDAVHRAAGLRPASACTARPGAAADLRLQDYRDIQRRTLRRHRLDRDVRGRGPRLLGQLLPAPCSASSSPAAAPASRASPSATTCSSATCSGTDFIQQYIFPGGLLPSPSAFAPRRQGRPGGGRELAFGADYAETLRRWRASFLAQEQQVRELGFRHALHAHLGVLPGLLRSGLCHRQHRCRAVHAAPAGLSAAGCCCAAGALAPAGRGARPAAAPPELAADLAGAHAAGSGALRFLGLRVYDARLWSPAPVR
jgi:cyclopropane-fatty-acyl-phospholipid synthase